jgi:hypothetical protein
MPEISRPAQRFLSAIRHGKTEQEAASRAGVPLADVRNWQRDEAFAVAYRQARAGKGGPRVINPRDYLGQGQQWAAAPSEREQAIADAIRGIR